MNNTVEIIKSLGVILVDFPFLRLQHEAIEMLLLKLDANELILPFIGEFKSGKSSLINMAIGQNLLESAPLEATASIYEISFSNDTDYFEMVDENNTRTVSNDLNELKKINEKHFLLIRVFLKDQRYPKGLTLVDTPGLSSLNKKLSNKCREYIDSADIVFFTVDVNQGITTSVIKHLNEIHSKNKQIILVLTKSDTKPEGEILKLKNQIEKKFAKHFSEIIVSSSKSNTKTILYKIQSLSESAGDILKKLAGTDARLIAAAAVALLAYTSKNSNLNVEEIDKEIAKKRKEFSKVKDQAEDIISDKIKKLGDIERSSIQQFDSKIVKTTSALTDAILKDSDLLEELFTAHVNKMVDEVATNSFNNPVSALLKETAEELSKVINETVFNNKASDLDLSKEIYIKISIPVITFISNFFASFGRKMADAADGTEDEELKGMFFIMSSLSLLMHKGVKLFTKHYVVKQIKLALENAKNVFKNSIHKIAEEVKSELKLKVEQQIVEIEKSLIDSLDYIHENKKDKIATHAALMEKLSKATNNIKDIINFL